MPERVVKSPGPDHPITIAPSREHVTVRVGGKVIADTREALILQEADYPAVRYIPRKDVDMAALSRSDKHTYCPYKGEASYYSITDGGERSIDAIWTYETPHEAMLRIENHLAFYPNRVDGIEVED